MALVAQKLHYRKSGAAATVNLYDSVSDVTQPHLTVRYNSKLLYCSLFSPSALNASNIRVRYNNTVYAVGTTNYTGTLTDTSSRHWHYSNSVTGDNNAGPFQNQIVDSVAFTCKPNATVKLTFTFNGTLTASTSPGWCEGRLYCSIVDVNHTTEYWRSSQLQYWTGPNGVGAVNTTYLNQSPVTLSGGGDYHFICWFAAHASGGDSCDVYTTSVTLTVN